MTSETILEMLQLVRDGALRPEDAMDRLANKLRVQEHLSGLKAKLLDPVGVRFYPYAGRDNERTPMVWNHEPNGGFTEPGVR